MEDTNLEIINSPNDTEGTEETNEEVVADTTTEETEEPEYSDNEKKLYARAKQAETELKALKNSPKPQAKSSEHANLSTKDTIAIIEAKVHSEDIDEVVEYAKFKGISTTEALKTNVVKTMLREKSEERKTADATNTGAARRGSSKVSDETLLERAGKGEMPDSDSDLDRLVRNRMDKQRGK